MLRQEEDGDSSGALPPRKGSDQSEREASFARRAADAAIQGLRAGVDPWTG